MMGILARARRLLRRAYHRMTASRPSGLQQELEFWDRWFRTRGLDWPEDYTTRLDAERELSGYHRRFIDHLPGNRVRILDVGAGPLTLVGSKHPSKVLEVVATDVLAREYDALLVKHGVTPPVRTVYADVERLTEAFPRDSFDFVNAQNSIDHTEHPLRAIEQMLEVVKPGCTVALAHNEREGEKEGYGGIHQWDFFTADGEFLMRGRRGITNISALLRDRADVECTSGDGTITVCLRKRSAAS